MLETDQIPDRFRRVIDDQISVFNQGRSVTVRNTIPGTSEIPLDNQKYWIKIPSVICVYVDMQGSTQLSAENADANTAGAFQLYTGCAVRLFDAFEAPYIDVRGDGAFALFNSNQPYTALAAAVTFKTFTREEYVPRVEKLCGVKVGSHIGIDQKTVLVRRIGLRQTGGRTDRQNEVWAGKPVNMAAKLASLTDDGEMLVSERYFRNLKDAHAIKSCGCPQGTKVDLWSEKDVSQDKRFDFSKAYCLKTFWCKKHGQEYCDAMLKLDI